MKKIIFILVFSFNVASAHNSPPKQIIDELFTALHAKDTTAIKQLCHEDIVIKTIANTKEGNKLVEAPFQDFLKSIATIPSNMKFFEKLTDYKVEIDGNLAHVWTPYEFYVNDTLSHVGANAFTLFNDNGKWQIIHLIDTRRKKSL